MTALGKILVFVVLILALIWNALVVNAYVSRANWKSELDKTTQKLAQASEAANAERTRADRTREAADAVIGQLKEEITRLRTTEQTLTASRDDFEKKLAATQAVAAGTETRDVQEKANAQKVQKQVDVLQKE